MTLVYLVIFALLLYCSESKHIQRSFQKGGNQNKQILIVSGIFICMVLFGILIWYLTLDKSSPTPTPTPASTQKYGKIQTVLQVISPPPPVTPIPPVPPVTPIPPVGPSSTIDDGTCQCAHGTGSRNCFSLPGEPGQYVKETCTGKTDETTCESVLSSGGKKRCKWVPNN